MFMGIKYIINHACNENSDSNAVRFLKVEVESLMRNDVIVPHWTCIMFMVGLSRDLCIDLAL